MPLYTHIPHPHIAQRKLHTPSKTTDHFGTGLSGWLAVKITSGMATMTCAAFFALLALVALPSAIQGGTYTTIQWVSQTFIQLTALSILAVGQRVLGKSSDQQALQTFQDVEALLAEVQSLQDHLQAQSTLLETWIHKGELQVHDHSHNPDSL